MKSTHMKNLTQWRETGYRPKEGSKPRKIEHRHSRRFGDYEVHYYAKNQVEPIRKRKPINLDPQLVITMPLVLDALWTLNKNVKNLLTRSNKVEDYALKELVLKRLEPLATKVETHYVSKPGRSYIRRANYLGFDEEDFDDDAYQADLRQAQWDQKGRPYLEGGTVYDVFRCLYFEGGYSFHTNPRFAVPTKPEDAILLAEGNEFVAPRRNVTNVTLARLILRKFISSPCTEAGQRPTMPKTSEQEAFNE